MRCWQGTSDNRETLVARACRSVARSEKAADVLVRTLSRNLRRRARLDDRGRRL